MCSLSSYALIRYRWIGTEANETLQTTLENFANENYAFAREKLADWVRVYHIKNQCHGNNYCFYSTIHFCVYIII